MNPAHDFAEYIQNALPGELDIERHGASLKVTTLDHVYVVTVQADRRLP